MSKFVFCAPTFYLMIVSMLVADASPVPDPVPIANDIERVEGPIEPQAVPAITMLPIAPESEIQTVEVAEPVRLQRSLLNDRLKSHHHHHSGHHHYRPHGHYGGGDEYYPHGHGGGGSFAGASAFSGSQGGYGGHGAGASAQSNSISFQTPFGGVSASQAYASSYAGRGHGGDPW